MAVVAAFEAERAAEHSLDRAKEKTDAAIRAAREAGVTYRLLEESTQVPEGSLRWRIKKDEWPSVTEMRERERSARSSRVGEQRPGRGPGLSVSDYARQESVSRRTVYAWIEKGKLDVVENEFGHTRIVGKS